MPVPDPTRPGRRKRTTATSCWAPDRRTVFAKDDFFVIDRGSDHGVTVGERVIIYRDKKQFEKSYQSSSPGWPKDIVPEFLFELGEAVVVDVKPEISTLKAIDARDAFLSGDYVALRK